MARSLLFSRRAEADLDRLEAFIATESVGRAEQTIEKLKHDLLLLAAFPELGVSLGDGIRQLVVRVRRRRAIYVVRYRLVHDAVLITRIWHGKEDRPR